MAEATAPPDGSLQPKRVLRLDNNEEQFKHAREGVQLKIKQRESAVDVHKTDMQRLLKLGEEIENEEAMEELDYNLQLQGKHKREIARLRGLKVLKSPLLPERRLARSVSRQACSPQPRGLNRRCFGERRSTK